jgi:short-subunit dehydrogenase
MAVYCATEAQVLSNNQAISEELGGTGASVTAVCPGPATTGFQDQADMRESARRREDACRARTRWPSMPSTR